MQTSAQLVLEEAPTGLDMHFETLPENIKTKAYRVLRNTPHLRFEDMFAEVESKLTLDEMVQARAWWKEFRK